MQENPRRNPRFESRNDSFGRLDEQPSYDPSDPFGRRQRNQQSSPAAPQGDPYNPPQGDPRVDTNWRLEDESAEPLRWMQLQNQGADTASQWQLESSEMPPPGEMGWQPTEYRREEPPRRNWVLPLLVAVALIAVVGYTAYVGLIQSGVLNRPANIFNGSQGEDTQAFVPVGEESDGASNSDSADGATNDPAVDGGVQDENNEVDPLPGTADNSAEAGNGNETSGDEPPPLFDDDEGAAPETLSATVEQEIATVNSQYGLNARSQPSANVDPLYVLDDGTRGYVLERDGGFTRILVIDGERGGEEVWVSNDFIDLETRDLERDQAVALGLIDGEPSGSTAAVDGNAGVNTDGEEANADAADAADNAEARAPSVELAGTINAAAGANARVEPVAQGDPAQVLANDTPITAIARTEASDWVRVRLANDTELWVSAPLVELAQPVETLPVFGAEPELAAQDAGAEESAAIVESDGASEDEPLVINEIETTPGEAVGNAVPAQPYTNIAPAAAAVYVDNEDGVNARARASASAPVSAALPAGAALSATSQDQGGRWVEVVLPGGDAAWVNRADVQTNAAVDDLPEAPDSLRDSGTADAGADDVEEPEPTAEATDATSNEQVGQGDIVFTTDVPDGPAFVVNDRIGVNAQPAPNTRAAPVARAPRSSALPVVGRSQNSEWVQVELSNGVNAWVLVTLGSLENVTLEELEVTE